MTTITDRTRTFARRITPWGFPIIYIAWAYLFWSPIFGSDTSVWEGTNLLFFLLGSASPLVAAVTMGWLTGGPERVRDLGHRLVDFRRIGARWWLVILLFWPAFDLVVSGAAIVLGVTDRPFSIVWEILTDPGTLAFMLFLWFLGPAVEEVGLRGYYFDRLRERYSTTVAGLVNGGTWALWHVPYVYFPGYYDDLSFSPELWWWLPYIVLSTLLIVWVYEQTGRSILAAVLFHGLMNMTGEVMGLAGALFPLQAVGFAVAAVLLIAYWRRRTPVPERRPSDVA
jgi:membrane protease YdiL (CAAX protease family)